MILRMQQGMTYTYQVEKLGMANAKLKLILIQYFLLPEVD